MREYQRLKLWQRIFYQHLQAQSDQNRTSCPDPGTLASLIDDKLDAEERSLVINHIVSCPSCAAEIKIIIRSKKLRKSLIRRYSVRRFFRRLKYPDPGWAKRTGTRIFKKNPAVIAVVLSAILLVSVFIILNKRNVATTGPMRGAADISLETHSPKKFGRYSPSSLTFRWDEIERAEYYLIEVFTSDLKRIWKSEKIFKNRYLPPDRMKILLNKRDKYYWIVTATLSSGITIESNLSEFFIR